jgi:hypothetical protein
MRLKTIFLLAFIVPKLSLAGGTLGTDELGPLLAQMPVVREFLRSSLRLSESAYSPIRLGPDFVHLSGARTGPYEIDATAINDGKPLVVVLCTSIRYLDSKGHELPGARINQAVSIEEKLTGVMLRQEGGGSAQPLC